MSTGEYSARLGVRALAALGLGFSVSAVLHSHKLGHAVSTDTAQQRSTINVNTVHKCSELWVVGFNVWSLLSLPDLKPDSHDAKKGFIIVLSALSSCHSLIATRKNSTSPAHESSSTAGDACDARPWTSSSLEMRSHCHIACHIFSVVRVLSLGASLSATAVITTILRRPPHLLVCICTCNDCQQIFEIL